MSTCTLTLVFSIKLKLKMHQQMLDIVMEWLTYYVIYKMEMDI